MMIKSLFAGAFFAGLLPLAAAETVRNGSFEAFGGDGVPEFWQFTLSGGAPVAVAPATPGADGEKCVRIVSRQPQPQPNRFGLLSQMLALEPDTDYTLHFLARGRDVGRVLWAVGKGWTIRYELEQVKDEWREYSFDFRLPADRMEGDRRCGLRLIVEGRCAELELDGVRVEPRKPGTVVNGSFEGKAGTVPSGWTFRRSGGAEAAATVDASAASTGRSSLHIVNNSPHKAEVYGALSQTLRLTEKTRYVLRARARGEGRGVNIAVGTRWRPHHRLQLHPLAADWSDYELEFELERDEFRPDGSTSVTIITENLAQGVWIDDLSITPKEQPELPQPLWQQHKVYRVPRLPEPFGSLKGIPAGVPLLKLPFSVTGTSTGKLPEPADFSAEAALAFDEKGVILLARITDDTILPDAGENMWRRDSIQLRIDRDAKRLPTEAPGDLEIGFSVAPDGQVRNWCWDAGHDPFSGVLSAELVQAHGFHTPGGWFLAARLGWKLLGPIRATGKFGFSFVVNDSDGPSHRAIYFLTPGVHASKYSDQYFQALLDNGKPQLWAAVPATPSDRQLDGSLLFPPAGGKAVFTARITDSAGKSFVRRLAAVSDARPDSLIRIPFSLPLDRVAKGDYTVDFAVNGADMARVSASRIDLYRQQLETVAQLIDRTGELREAFRAFHGDRPVSEYVSIPLDILSEELPRLQRQLEQAKSDGEKRHYAEQAAMVRPEVEELLADLSAKLALLRSGGRLPEAWHFRSGPVKLDRGWPVAAAVSESGRAERRPMIFTGYGHFNGVSRDIARFQHLGANVIQVELGPQRLFPREGKEREFEPDFSYVDAAILPLMEKAYRNNVKIALLISPHYHPEWLLKKYPEMASSSGFLKYEVTHPKAQEMLQAYTAALMSKLRGSPWAGALHSICISNEPVYTGCRPDNPFSAAAFRRYMDRKYGSLTAFNRIAKRQFGSYDAMLDAIRRHDPAARYEFYTFSRETFAGWHRMLAEAVRKGLPGIPVHTKIMVFSSPFEYVTGVDPELMTEFSDYNGNDNYFHRRGRWIADWNVTALTHEMQISARPAAVANTENHIIPDRETRPVSNDLIYTANFQQFITGAATLVTWVWQELDYNFVRGNPRHVFNGNIRQRPGNIAAHAISGLDGVRLAPEIRKFMDYRPEAAILYAPTALILSPGEYRARIDALYTQLCFTGYRVRFLSERRLARGESGGVKLLFAVGAKNITREAFDGLKRFAASGGRIARDAESLTHDQYNNPLPVLPDTEKAAAFTPEQLLAQLHRHIAPLPVSLTGNREGIFFRAVPDGKGNWLVNLVNYNFEPRPVRLEGNGSWTDLIGERPFHPRFTLAPLKPQLLRFTPAE